LFAHGFSSKAKTTSGEEEGETNKAAGKGKESNTQVGQPVEGINYKKGGSDPLIKEDHEYPDWLWSMLDPKPTLSELERKLNPILAKDLNGIDDLRKLRDQHEQDIRRYAKLLGTARVKENNKGKEK
jgi:large subunit ribosomal protein L54